MVVVAAGGAVVFVHPDDGSIGVSVTAGDDGDADAVGKASAHGAVVYASYAAVVEEEFAVSVARDGGCAGAVLYDGAAARRAHYAAVVVIAALVVGTDEDGAGDVAAGYGASTQIAHHAADIRKAGEVAVADGKVVDACAVVKASEDTDVGRLNAL